MSNKDLPPFAESEEREKIIELLRSGSVATESIDLDALLQRTRTDSGSFDMRALGHSAVGQILGVLPIPACLIDKTRKIVMCNEAWGRVTPSFERLQGLPFSSLCPLENEARETDALLEDVFFTRKARVREQRLRVGERVVWGRLYLRTVRFTGYRMILCLIEDLTSERFKILLLKLVEQAKKEWELTFDSVPNLIAIINGSCHTVRVNKAVIDRLGLSYQDALHKTCYELFHGATEPPDFCPRSKVLACRTEHSIGYYSERLGGHFEETLSPIVGANEGEMNCVLVATDVSERKKLEKTLYYRATHDALTGVLNRSQTLELVRLACESSNRYGHPLSLAFCDLDKFKRINEVLGHQIGDKVLRRFGAMVKGQTRVPDIVGRYGGDEFILAFPGASVQEALKSLERLQSKVTEICFEMEGKAVSLSCSIGLGGYDAKTMTLKELIRKADEALSAAKKKGGHCIVSRE